jgi:uncharacterized protein DUF4382
MYSFPVWRRAPFISLLIIIFVIAYAPATTLGTATIRFAAQSAPSSINHIYLGISSIQLHREGFLNWTTIPQPLPIIDLLSTTSQSTPQTITSASVHSGRYDAIKIFFTSSTISISGRNQTVAAPPELDANTTMLVAPNGIGDLLLIVAFDYAALYATTPSLSFILISVSAV